MDLRLVAPVSAVSCGFDTIRLAAPSGPSLTLEYTVEDAGKPHNFALYRDSDHDDLIVESDYHIGGERETIEIGPLDPGTYYFVCQPHRRTMFGTLTVADE